MIRTLLLFLFLYLSVAPAFADDAEMHEQSAFLFGKRHDWNDAILHARAAHSAILEKYFTWEYLKDPESGADFASIAAFIDANPHWPDQPALLRRAEVAILASNPSDAELKRWFDKHPPQTSMARMKTAADEDTLRSIIRDAWVTDDYSQKSESQLLIKYGTILRSQDHVRRIDRLIWEGKYDEAKRLLKWAPRDYQRLFQTRISLAEDRFRAMLDVLTLPGSVASDPGFLYERIRARARHGDHEAVLQGLLKAPAIVPYPEKWWPLRERQIREALDAGDVALAEKLLAHHSQKPGTPPYKEAQWLTGWILLKYRHQPAASYHVFYELYKETDTPAGKSRVAYWAARAAEETSKENAGKWLAIASHYPTTFYGQLAMSEMNDAPILHIHADSIPGEPERLRFQHKELVQLVYVLARARQSDMAQKFILFLVENAPNSEEAVLATRLGHDIHRIDFGVRAAKKAMHDDVIVLQSGYPVIPTKSLQPEKALVLAITRQESEFLADAMSGSNARGLMQLLPGTAKELARKGHMPYSVDRLFNTDYNIMLGSLYLEKMIEHFSGSYVLAIASYNAGPGRVAQWTSIFGTPGNTPRSAADWIEKIPFFETRNYVQHVIENTEVYRFVLAGYHSVPLKIDRDLTR